MTPGTLRYHISSLVLAAFWLLVLIVLTGRAGAAARPRRPRLWWGPEPIITIAEFADALAADGYASTTCVSQSVSIYPDERFSRTYDDVIHATRVPAFLARHSADYLAFAELVRGHDIAHLTFFGGPLGWTPLRRLEPWLLRRAGVRTVAIPYGGDFWRYSTILEAQVRHAFLLDYPEAGRREDLVERRVKRWMRHADVVVGGFMVEGASRWDTLTTSYLVVGPERVPARESFAPRPSDRPLRVVHAPNHRGVKGSEFLLAAVDALRAEGHGIELELLERRPNAEVVEAIRAADICFDHCIGSGFGMFALEAMAAGAVVMANLEDEQRLGLHRVFGWLDQCPVVSANAHQVESTLRWLLERPETCVELGAMGVDYVRRFHHPDMARHLFGSIYRSLAGEDVDLMRLFHPLTSDWVRSRGEPLRPPLVRNRPPDLV